MKIWFRAGMEADITQEEMEALQNPYDRRKAEHTMRTIIDRAELSGETYIVGKSNGGVDDYDNPEEEMSFIM